MTKTTPAEIKRRYDAIQLGYAFRRMEWNLNLLINNLRILWKI